VKKILVVDDSEFMKDLLKQAISKSAVEAQPEPLNDGLATLPDRGFIEWLAKDNLILNAAIRTGEASDWPWETTMMYAVKMLLERGQLLEKTMIENAQKYGMPSFKVEKSG
jgi:hypothetical protein